MTSKKELLEMATYIKGTIDNKLSGRLVILGFTKPSLAISEDVELAINCLNDCYRAVERIINTLNEPTFDKQLNIDALEEALRKERMR